MSRSSRLLNLLQALRRYRRPVTAAALARELAISKRTVYRDIAALVGQGAPIDGERASATCSGPASCCRR